MKEISEICCALSEWRKGVEILPALGGAQEDLLHPDPEEHEELFYTDEKIFDTVFEYSYKGDWWRRELYRQTPPIFRSEQHLFRYFLDGSLRSYFLGTVLEGDRSSPIYYAQIGACVLFRRNDGTVEKEFLQTRHLILIKAQSISKKKWQNLKSLLSKTSVMLEDLATHNYGNIDLRILASGKIRYKMRELEIEAMKQVLDKLSKKCWLIIDGSLMFQPILQTLQRRYSNRIPPVLGVSKNFRKDPQFVFGRGPRAQRFSIYSLLAHLKHEHRTAAFSAYDGQVVFWYVRLRPQEQVDYPLMGVVKCELVTPNRKPVPTELIDLISRALVAERNVTPHGYDHRWHVHLYPIFLAERAIRSAFYSREVVQQLMSWR